jgi:hypothetical protein
MQQQKAAPVPRSNRGGKPKQQTLQGSAAEHKQLSEARKEKSSVKWCEGH